MDKVHRRFVVISVWGVLWWVHQVTSLSHPQWKEQRFCYDPKEDCGPESWEGTCSSGRRQSPIDISAINKQQLFPQWTQFQFNKEYQSTQNTFFARNTGHTFQIQLQESSDPTSELEFWGAALKDKYRFGQLHFHWGSEHTFNGKRYPLELHIVHHKEQYATCVEAFDAERDPDALAVFAIFFKVGNHNKALDSIIGVANLQESLEPKENFMQYMMQRFNLEQLLPNKLNFVRYPGSLTTPPCTENVLWTVFLEPVTLSMQQLMTFQRLLNEEEDTYMNFRPTQDYNGRRIEYFGVSSLKRSFITTTNNSKHLLNEIVGWVLNFLGIQILANVTLWKKLASFMWRVLFPLPIYVNAIA